jgi:hypothetical protein
LVLACELESRILVSNENLPENVPVKDIGRRVLKVSMRLAPEKQVSYL